MRLLDFLFPPRCVGCKKIGSYICQNCRASIVFRDQLCPACDKPAIDGMTHPKCLTAWGLERVVSICKYQGVVEKAIKQLKYQFVSDTAQTLISLIPPSAYLLIPKTAVLYPIPLHKDRLKWRGFNQAQKLAQILAPKLKIKLISGLLIRTQKRTPQADVRSRQNRIKNAQGLFTLSPAVSISQYPNILLFDDVWTTGATMKEAAKVLKRVGVQKVYGLTIAR